MFFFCCLQSSRRRGVLFHGRRDRPEQSSPHAVASGHGSSAPRRSRVPASNSQHVSPADLLRTDKHPASVPRQTDEVFPETAQSEDARFAPSQSGREQKVPQGVRYGAAGSVVYAVQVEESVQPFRGLIEGQAASDSNKRVNLVLFHTEMCS